MGRTGADGAGEDVVLVGHAGLSPRMLFVTVFVKSVQSDDEKQMLKEYLTKHTKPTLFSDTSKIDSTLQQIEACLQRT